MRLYSTVLGQQVEDKVKKDSEGTSYGPFQVLFKHLTGGTEVRHRKTCHNSHCHGKDLNWAATKHKPGVFLLHQSPWCHSHVS